MSADPTLLVDAHLAGPIGRSTLLVASGELGVREQPDNSNRGPRVDQYLAGIDGTEPELLCGLRYAGERCALCGNKPRPTPACRGSRWCCRFIVWCVTKAARNIGQPLPIADWGGLASTLKWRDQAKARRCWVETPAPGRVGLIVSPSGHGVLIARVDGDSVITIEGNAGNQVGSHRRYISQFDGGFVELG